MCADPATQRVPLWRPLRVGLPLQLYLTAIWLDIFGKTVKQEDERFHRITKNDKAVKKSNSSCKPADSGHNLAKKRGHDGGENMPMGSTKTVHEKPGASATSSSRHDSSAGQSRQASNMLSCC